MKLSILLFAGLAERFGTTILDIEIQATSMKAGELLQALISQYPEHAEALGACFLACNQAYASSGEEIRQGDELALIPPVSGGEEPDDRYCITNEPLDIQHIIAKVGHSDHGASLAFIGTTREMTNSDRTIRLEYEAYVPMALKTLRQIGTEIDERWPGTQVAITHRLGVVEIGEASVVIAVSAPHRDACYEANRYAIERLKQIVPIWKKEFFENGSVWKGHQLGPWNPKPLS